MTPSDLQQWRKQNQMSQGKLALALGVDKMTVSRWERGLRAMPAFLHLALKSLNEGHNPQTEDAYVACSGCGLRNYDTTDPHWSCPEFPDCAPWIM